jgi:hypothetical protein
MVRQAHHERKNKFTTNGKTSSPQTEKQVHHKRKNKFTTNGKTSSPRTEKQAHHERGSKELEAWIADNGFKVLGPPVWARYNPPFTPWFMRRNEILIPVDSGKK